MRKQTNKKYGNINFSGTKNIIVYKDLVSLGRMQLL